MSDAAISPVLQSRAVLPPAVPLRHRLAELEPLAEHHLADLWQAFAGEEALWEFMFSGPFAGEAEFTAWARAHIGLKDPGVYALRAPGGPWTGMASFMRIDPANAVIEVGSIAFSPALQGTAAATGAMIAMMEQAFALGYRRYEWKCNSRNLPSRRAAARLGFSYEGLFRQHMIAKGRNRDTAWFSILDSEWPALKAVFDRWSAPENFDAAGQQILRLSELTAPLLQARDPELS